MQRSEEDARCPNHSCITFSLEATSFSEPAARLVATQPTVLMVLACKWPHLASFSLHAGDVGDLNSAPASIARALVH